MVVNNKVIRFFLMVYLLPALLMCCFSCSQQESALPKEVPTGKKAYAILKPIKSNHVTGLVTFIALEKGVRVIAKIEGLAMGSHGFHIYEFGDCSAADGSSAGEHYNPTNSIHAGPLDQPRHAGDLGNVIADKKGVAHYDYVDFMLALDGEHSIVGKSIVIHRDPDDYVTQPAGNSGPRIACGVIRPGAPDKMRGSGQAGITSSPASVWWL